ncbi:MAG: hypothetical protein HYW48_00525 [Deltaproteobacteria bacterium]|nr:hypothetical protein [Deltaproteobacteria bacterium]
MSIRFFLFLSFILWESGAFAKMVSRLIPFPDRANSIETIEQSIRSLMLLDDRLFAFPDRDYFVTVPVREVGTTREARFGTLVQQKRVPGPLEAYLLGNSFPIPNGHSFLLFDGDAVEMTGVNETFQLVARRSIVVDLLTPPKDRGGAAPWTETVQLRKRFLTVFLKSGGLKFGGAARVPETWWKAEGLRVFLAGRWDSFPLFSLLCDKDYPTQCSLEHACFVDGLGSAGNVRGLAVREDLRLILLGNEVNNVISVVKFNSCFDSMTVGKISLPSQLKKMTDIFVDEKNRLWVSTLQPDDYNNASVFVWDAKDWWGR